LKKTIFAVDDCDMSLTVVEFALADKYIVHTINTLGRMFDLLEETLPDLILLDLYMPDMTCQEVMARLKANERHAEIPVIIISGSRNDDVIKECAQMGAVHFISKPVMDPLDLDDQIKPWI